MKIIFYDKSQDADGIPLELTTAPLTETYIDLGAGFAFSFLIPTKISSLALGNAQMLQVEITAVNLDVTHLLNVDNTTKLLTFADLNDTDFIVKFIGSNQEAGRLILGESNSIGIAVSRSTGYDTTHRPLTTASGQRVLGLSGVALKTISIVFNYAFNGAELTAIEIAKNQMGSGFPLVFSFEEEVECRNYHIQALYGYIDGSLAFNSDNPNNLWSGRWNVTEAF